MYDILHPAPVYRLSSVSSCRKEWQVFMQKRGKGKNIGYSCMNPTPRTRILHPILHPKLSVNKRPLVFWCRKCRRFSKTFFVEGRSRRPTGRCKTSDFFGQKYGCFAPKVRMFSSKKSDVFIFRKGNSII